MMVFRILYISVTSERIELTVPFPPAKIFVDSVPPPGMAKKASIRGTPLNTPVDILHKKVLPNKVKLLVL